MPIIRLAFRLLLRDWRAGELRLLVLALIIAVSAVLSIGFFTNRLDRTLSAQAADLLGADLMVTGPVVPPQSWRDLAQTLQLKTNLIIRYPTMASTGTQLQMVDLRAVTPGYPLRGTLKIATSTQQKAQISHTIPAPGTLWVDARLLDLLHLKIGDSLNIGVAPLRVSHILSSSPQTNIINIAPTLLINQMDLAKTQTLLPGSRVAYQLAVTGPAAAIGKFTAAIKPQLSSSQKILASDKDQPATYFLLQRAANYLTLVSLLCIILAGIAISNATYRYSERHYNNTALLRCLGLTRWQLVQLISLQLLVMGVAGSAIGCVGGYFGQLILEGIFAPWLNLKLAAPDFTPVITAFLSGLALLLGFALPRLLKLIHIAPVQVLRKEERDAGNNNIIAYGLAIAALSALLLWHTRNVNLTLIVLYAVGLVGIVFYAVARALIQLSSLLKGTTAISWRYGLANLARRPSSSTLQLMAFSLIVLVAVLLVMLRQDLLNTWRAQIPKNAPNYFAINIQPSEIKAFDSFLDQNQIKHSKSYPVVRGRMVQLNGSAIKQAVPVEAQNNNALNRELNLTWSQSLPEFNTITAGQWVMRATQPVVSIEQELAKKLNIKMGDVITFQIADQSISARVINIRHVEWLSFRPNFIIIFTPGVIENYPTTYLSSFYLPPAQRMMLTQLSQQFPSVTLIDTTEIIAQIQAMINSLSLALLYLMSFTLLASFAVLFSTLHATLPERQYEAALLRTLGASRQQIRRGLIIEFSILGLLSGLLGSIAAASLAAILASKVFSLHYAINYPLCFSSIAITTMAVLLAGLSGTRSVAKQSALTILRKAV